MKYQKYIDFQAFSVLDCNFQSVLSCFPREKELIDSISGSGGYPLLYEKLYIQGNEIKGFPPSKKMISDILKDHGVSIVEDNYQFNYGATDRKNQQCDRNKLHIKNAPLFLEDIYIMMIDYSSGLIK